jgi:subtilisin family serine protease
MRGATAAGILAVLLLMSAIPASAASSVGSGASADAKLKGGLGFLVSGAQHVDPRIPSLVHGYRTGEIPAFVLFTGGSTAAHRHAVTNLGARVLRRYHSVPMIAIAARPKVIRSVASLSYVRWLSPVQVTYALDDQEHMVNQSKPPIGTPIDLRVPQLWNQGITGKGVTIAILDTGVDSTHPDLDDLDFRHWGDGPNPPNLNNPPKVTASRNFNAGLCAAPGSGSVDAHGHGTHVAGIAAGTGEGDPTTAADDGRVMGIAPDANLAAAKVMTDAGTGVNSDLIAAMEWASMPAGTGDPNCPAIGAQVVNMSLGSESRPNRLNTGDDVDAVSYVLDHLAATYGTVFSVAQGNSGPYIGSNLEAPGSASQAMSVGATAKDWDLNHNNTASGDTCSGYQHPKTTCPATDPGTQGASLAPLSSRGPIEGAYLKPDLVAPGLNIVSTEGAGGTAIHSNDLNRGTRGDPLYATASGTSMAAPAAAGVAALILGAYHDRFGTWPSGASGRSGVSATAYALVRAALMNTARTGLDESRWVLTTDDGTLAYAAACPKPGDPLTPTLCDFADIITSSALGTLILQGPRNGASDPYVGPFGEGAGKIDAGQALTALRSGVVVYSALSSGSDPAQPGHPDYQGAWQASVVRGGQIHSTRFVVHSAHGAKALTAKFSFASGNPSDESLAIPVSGPDAWSITLPSTVSLAAGGADRLVTMSMRPPAGTAPGFYSGSLIVKVSNGQTLHLPVLASVPLHDPNPSSSNKPGPTAHYDSAKDVYAKGDTTWPSAEGQAGGAMADWLGLDVELGKNLTSVRFAVWDTAAGDETYDLYLYRDGVLVATTHPFTSAGSGITDTNANNARGPSTQASPDVLTVSSPAAGRYVLVVNRAKVGSVDAINGDFGSFDLTLDEVK